MPLTNVKRNLRCILFSLFLLGLSPHLKAKSYLVYSIAQDLPMGDNAVLKKNYYLNIGAQQGIKEGSELTVYRQLNQSNPYAIEKNVTYNVPIGELKVIHAEEENSIAVVQKAKFEDSLYHEISTINIGDAVEVKTGD